MVMRACEIKAADATADVLVVGAHLAVVVDVLVLSVLAGALSDLVLALSALTV